MKKSYPQNIPDQILSEDQSSFLIRPVLSQINRKPKEDLPHRHKFHEIIYIRTGTGKHYIDSEEIELKPHTFYCIHTNQVHGFDYGQNLEGYLIRFTEDFLPLAHDKVDILRDYSNTILLHNKLQLDEQRLHAFELLMNLMLEEYKSDSQGKQQTLQNLLFALLNKITTEVRDQFNRLYLPGDDKDRNLFNQFILLANQHFTQHHSLAFYSGSLGVSNRKLSNVCSKYSGNTAKSIILDKLISEIKRYLSYSSLSLKQIAYRLNFDDPAYMSRLFKRYTNLTMSEYRKNTQIQLKDA